MEITKREVIASITIIAVWICIGLAIAGKINDWQQDKNAEYDRAARIVQQDLFVHGMKTNIGNAFVYGELQAVDPVTYPEIDGQYCVIQKVKERHTMHTRVVTYTTGSGKNKQTHTKTETYWTWDEIGRDEQYSEEFDFLAQRFDRSKFNLPGKEYIETIKESSNIRYKYYGIPDKLTGTIYTVLKDGTISDGSEFYDGMDIEETAESMETDAPLIIFWFIWIVLMIAIVAGFYYLENDWLNRD